VKHELIAFSCFLSQPYTTQTYKTVFDDK